MVPYEVIVQPTADQHIRDIYTNSAQQGRWSFTQTDAYVTELEQRIYSLDQNPQRFSYDEHTQRSRQYRSFQHGAHKVFFSINESTQTVGVIAVLPSRMNYSDQL